MAIYVKTPNSDELLESIKQKTDNYEIINWIVDNDGDYTMSREQWRYHAWFRVIKENDRLIFGIVQSRKYPMTNILYGIYHGRMSETLLIYFSDFIEKIEVTPDPIIGIDIIS